ncbi:10744_t:CDS:2 [Funneliformis caledonium]|uniref:10744_t:CDS:1 n=1 Tax=Funneliformis caledonium TaxID=1117310 RepID=A0A9N9CFN7_9GLOM|nr:10744_t:CDS:2 [Funneliformis caledonium]
MNNNPNFIRPGTLRKRKSKENETPDQQEKYHAYNQEYKRKKLAEETTEQRETRLRCKS